MEKRSSNMGIYLIGMLLVMSIIYFWTGTSATVETVSRQAYETMVESGTVTDCAVRMNKEGAGGQVLVRTSSGESGKIYTPDVKEEISYLEKNNVSYTVSEVPGESWFTAHLLPLLVVLVIVFIFFFMLNKQATGGNSSMMNFGKSRAKMTVDGVGNINFKKVAGLDEEKEDLREIVDFLKEPEKYTQVGARIPKGVLLVGPPGTGKTLLAKAVAGEAGVPFFSISGSDFVEMFVGVGASRVRDLFEDAKKNAPCIVFIDEIDAVARQRGTGLGGGHDEREQTLNQLLVEMDGFGVNEGIIVMAATNRVDILDPAILRPGRFDRKVGVGKPDVKGRLGILKVHAKGKPLGEDVNLEEIAETTPGFSGADLENLMNEAAILAAKNDRKYLVQNDIKQSFVKVGIGQEKKSRIISPKEKRITAYHESGHAILYHVLPDVGPVYTVSIIPTGMGAAGYTMAVPEKDEMFMTRGKMIQEIMVSLGGRIAEELILDDITTGASQDIKHATGIARAMVTEYGMSSEIGMLCLNDDGGNVFIGKDLAHAKGYSETMATKVDLEVKRIVDECYAQAKKIILEHIDILHESAQLLLQKEKISRVEFEALFAPKAIEMEETPAETQEEAPGEASEETPAETAFIEAVEEAHTEEIL